MLRVLNIVLVCAVVGVAVWLYELKYGVRGSVSEIAQLQLQIKQAKQDITLLRAEWSHLSRPKRLQDLSSRHLHLQPVRPGQIIQEQDILTGISEREPYEPMQLGEDPIASLLRIDQ